MRAAAGSRQANIAQQNEMEEPAAGGTAERSSKQGRASKEDSQEEEQTWSGSQEAAHQVRAEVGASPAGRAA
eukprot:gene28900-32093_t